MSRAVDIVTTRVFERITNRAVGFRWTNCSSAVYDRRLVPTSEMTRLQGVVDEEEPVRATTLVYAGKRTAHPQFTALITDIDIHTPDIRNYLIHTTSRPSS